MNTYRQAEAFRLMTYRADDGEEEVVWNSRDGVTPYAITLRSGKEARHKPPWSADPCIPNYMPPLGSRIFVDVTRERAEASAKRNAARFYADPQFKAQIDAQGGVDALARTLALSYYTPGAPDLIEVTG